MPEKVSSGCLRHHPVTGQLSSLLLTILGWRRPGKIGSANTEPRDVSRGVLSCPEECSSGCLRHHPVTGQLSSLLPTILGWRRPGKIGSVNTKPRDGSRGVLSCPEKFGSGCLRHHPVTGQWVCLRKGRWGHCITGGMLCSAAREETPAGINGGLRASRPMGQVR